MSDSHAIAHQSPASHWAMEDPSPPRHLFTVLLLSNAIWFGITLWKGGVRSPSSSLCIPSLHADKVAWKTKKSLTLCNHFSETKYQCIINIILFLNPSHSTIAATREKVNSIPTETRTSNQWKLIFSLNTNMHVF